MVWVVGLYCLEATTVKAGKDTSQGTHLAKDLVERNRGVRYSESRKGHGYHVQSDALVPFLNSLQFFRKRFLR